MAAAVTWGTTGATMVLVARRSPLGAGTIGFFRLLVASPILLALAGLTGSFSASPLRPFLLRLALIGAAQAAFQIGYFGAVPRIGVGPTALLAICTSPLIIAVLAASFLGERLTARVAVALTAGIAGTALLVGRRFMLPGSPTATAVAGAALALGGALAYALYVVLAKAVVAHLPPLAIAGVSFSFAALFLLPAALGEPNLLAAIRPVWAHVAYLGIVPTALAYTLYVRGLRFTSATAAGIGSLMEPLTATLLGIAVFDESLGPQGLAGGALLLAGVALLFLGDRRRL